MKLLSLLCPEHNLVLLCRKQWFCHHSDLRAVSASPATVLTILTLFCFCSLPQYCLSPAIKLPLGWRILALPTLHLAAPHLGPPCTPCFACTTYAVACITYHFDALCFPSLPITTRLSRWHKVAAQEIYDRVCSDLCGVVNSRREVHLSSQGVCMSLKRFSLPASACLLYSSAKDVLTLCRLKIRSTRKLVRVPVHLAAPCFIKLPTLSLLGTCHIWPSQLCILPSKRRCPMTVAECLGCC